MRILILSSQAKNTGSTLRAEYFFKYLKKKNQTTDYITPPFNSMPFFLDFILTFFYYFFKILNKKYDLIFIVKPYPNTVLPALLLKLKGGKIIIDIDDLDYGYRGGLISQIIKFIQKKLINLADYLTSHNDELIKLLKSEHKKYKDRIYKLKQCVDLELFKATHSDLISAKKIQKKYKNKKILFYMANLNIASYLDDILQAFSSIKNEDIILIIAGGGPLLNHYKNIAKKMNLSGRVEFLGAKKQQEIIKYIIAADLCIVYYKNIPVNEYRASMKLREYLALKKQVVANNVGEMKEFKKYINLSRNDIKDFASIIKKRIYSLDKLNKKGYKYIIDEYNWEKEAKKFYNFFIKDKLLWKRIN